MKIVECVPNFSEGRDRRVIDAIADAVRSVSGVQLLDVDAGAATNRTVYTLAGEPEAVLEAAFQAIRKGVELIDMRAHKGEHARQGACDVCPFVPISGMTLEECAELARRLGRRVGEELRLPVYLYAEAAARPERRRLPDIRAGEYEALEAKLKQPEWAPDFGPARFDAKAGALVVGARAFLIAYNVNLNTSSVALAKHIAFEIRETGKPRKDAAGKAVVGADGKPERIPGLFKSVQATGWFIPEYDRAQVTINILDIDASPLHKVYDACCDLASRLGCRVTGSEVVGLVPERVLLEAGRYFLNKQGATTGVSDREVLHAAALSLGLSDVSPFDPAKKIIEERFRRPEPLAAMSVKAFAAELASHSPAPGGGSVAALAGALGAGLASMVAALTHEKKGFADRRAEMEEVGVKAQELMAQQLKAVDEDTAAFKRVLACFGMPKASPEQQAARQAALEAANQAATLEPLGTLERTLPTLDCALAAGERGNPNSLSDAGVAGLMARAAALGAYYNVLINLPGISDEAWRRDVRLKADRFLAEAQAKADRLEKLLLSKLSC
ncbi:MAG: glutamate formimidoyltransferase [Elusimicrobia bacterium GWA2_69_24]|nr:MAG: glutamate formimidoyltransferase [Elusimicrobia bacterium GWA2_69_24]HBL18693.1 glutamate formimidoyltransferase [Elusimicrobiota bacterium]